MEKIVWINERTGIQRVLTNGKVPKTLASLGIETISPEGQICIAPRCDIDGRQIGKFEAIVMGGREREHKDTQFQEIDTDARLTTISLGDEPKRGYQYEVYTGLRVISKGVSYLIRKAS